MSSELVRYLVSGTSSYCFLYLLSESILWGKLDGCVFISAQVSNHQAAAATSQPNSIHLQTGFFLLLSSDGSSTFRICCSSTRRLNLPLSSCYYTGFSLWVIKQWAMAMPLSPPLDNREIMEELDGGSQSPHPNPCPLQPHTESWAAAVCAARSQLWPGRETGTLDLTLCFSTIKSWIYPEGIWSGLQTNMKVYVVIYIIHVLCIKFF